MTDSKILDDRALDILFRDARTYNGWQDREVGDVLIHAMYDLLKMAPTSANCSPGRFLFIKSQAAKERLRPFMDAGNLEKTMKAPVTAIIANDRKFYDHLPRLFPHADAKGWFAGNDAKIESTQKRNGTLQGAYLIMAARALGLDCGPMSGFNNDGVKAEFFPDQDVEVNFLCNIGYGDESSLFPRSPRFSFDDACKIL